MATSGHRRNGGVVSSSQSILVGVLCNSMPVYGRYLLAREKETSAMRAIRAGQAAAVTRNRPITLVALPPFKEDEA